MNSLLRRAPKPFKQFRTPWRTLNSPTTRLLSLTHINRSTSDAVNDQSILIANLGKSKQVILSIAAEDGVPQKVLGWFEKVLDHNCGKGKLIRAKLLLSTFRLLTADRLPTADRIEEAVSLAWAVEHYLSFLAIHDDMLDNGITRRGRPCWHTMEGVGISALNDSQLALSAVFLLVKSQLQHHPLYQEIVELISKVHQYTYYGQWLDTYGSLDFESFTASSHSEVCLTKTGYVTAVFPLRLALYLSGNGVASDHQQTEDVMMKIGELFQLQDDYIDCFSDPSVTGKDGNDIAQGKCNWMIILAMEQANDGQKQVLRDNFGKGGDKGALAKVKETYHQLGIVQVYEALEAKLFNEIKKGIVDISKQTNLPTEMFYAALNVLHKRKV